MAESPTANSARAVVDDSRRRLTMGVAFIVLLSCRASLFSVRIIMNEICSMHEYDFAAHG
jgi:hypothetical protein